MDLFTSWLVAHFGWWAFALTAAFRLVGVMLVAGMIWRIWQEYPATHVVFYAIGGLFVLAFIIDHAPRYLNFLRRQQPLRR
jgi:hypothetical protein